MAVNNPNAVQAAPTSAVDPVIADAMQLKGRLDPLRDALGLNDLSPGEMDLFAMVALRMELDPFARQIYAIKRKGKVTFQTGIDGFRSSAEATGQYRGTDEPEFGPIEDKPFPHPAWARVVAIRRTPDGDLVRQPAVARWDEFFPGEGGDGFMWKKMPFSQLAKCAEAQALRKAFPRRFGQVYVDAEMDQADAVDAAIPVNTPTQRDRIAQQRASIEARTTSAASEASDSDRHQAVEVGSSLAAAAPTPAPEAAPSAEGAGAAVPEDVIDGQAVDVTVEGISAGDLRQWLRDQLIGITETRPLAQRLFGRDSIDKLTDAERGILRAELAQGVRA